MSEILSEVYAGGLTPRLDYYYGRVMEEFHIVDGGVEITLTGSVKIKGQGDVVGSLLNEHPWMLATAVFSVELTRLRFQTVKDEICEVAFEPSEYSITDPAYRGGVEYFPQRNADPFAELQEPRTDDASSEEG